MVMNTTIKSILEKDFTNVVKLGNKAFNSKDTKINKDKLSTIYPTFNEEDF